MHASSIELKNRKSDGIYRIFGFSVGKIWKVEKVIIAI